MSKERVAFLGIGNMGGPMAVNLVKAGYPVTVFDPVADNVRKLVAEGALGAGSVADAVREADIVITMLPGNTQMETCYSEIFAAVKKTALLVDCSTVGAALAKDIAQRAHDQGFDMIDAPVSGGTAGAAAATLTFMIGGSDKAVARAKPALEKMGKNFFHAGPSGAGQVAKMCNNMLLAITMIGTSEALRLGMNHGLDPAKISEIMSKSSGRNWVLEVYNPAPGVMENVPASREYSGGFATDLMLKDLGLSQDAAQATETETPMGALARKLYQKHSERGQGKLDFSSIFAQSKTS